jgi:integrase
MTPIGREKYLDIDEIRQLRTVTEARHTNDLRAGRSQGVLGWMVVDLALSTGLRVSEIAALQIEDIDIRRRALKVVRNKKRVKKAETMPISKELGQHLKEYLAWTEHETGPLLMGQRGPLTAQGLQRVWKRSIKLARLPKELSIHCARHSIAVYLLKKTGNLRMVQKQLGHSSPATTANMYADISFEDMQDGLNDLYSE